MIIGSLILIAVALVLIPSWTAWLVLIPAFAIAGYWCCNQLSRSSKRDDAIDKPNPGAKMGA